MRGGDVEVGKEQMHQQLRLLSRKIGTGGLGGIGHRMGIGNVERSAASEADWAKCMKAENDRRKGCKAQLADVKVGMIGCRESKARASNEPILIPADAQQIQGMKQDFLREYDSMLPAGGLKDEEGGQCTASATMRPLSTDSPEEIEEKQKNIAETYGALNEADIAPFIEALKAKKKETIKAAGTAPRGYGGKKRRRGRSTKKRKGAKKRKGTKKRKHTKKRKGAKKRKGTKKRKPTKKRRRGTRKARKGRY